MAVSVQRLLRSLVTGCLDYPFDASVAVSLAVTALVTVTRFVTVTVAVTARSSDSPSNPHSYPFSRVEVTRSCARTQTQRRPQVDNGTEIKRRERRGRRIKIMIK